jgi:hypothetical protein
MANQPMKVDNTAFLIDKLAADCAPLQFVRELTENAIQAIQARRERGWAGEGQVIWDVDWHLVEKEGVYKLEISDNGTGMSGPEIQKYINHLASSGRQQDIQKNFGLGAKITACVHNPDGLIYKSWVEGDGVLAILCREEQAGYGLRQLDAPDGGIAHFIPVEDAAKSGHIDSCGTSVTLMGRSRNEDTFMPPDAKNKWLIKYLNDRYFEFPAGVTIQVRNFQKTDRAGWPKSRGQKMGEESGSQMRTISGMRYFLDGNTEKKGVKDLTGAKLHWWVFPKAGVSQADIWESRAHCAALYQRELYDFTRGRAGTARIKEFGIPIGTQRVVLYVEPDPNSPDIFADTGRSNLKKAGESLPWAEWAAEFRADLPAELKAMMDDEIAASKSEDNSENNRARLKEIEELLKYGNYRKSPAGKHPISPGAVGGESGDKQLGKQGGTGGGGGGGRGGNPYGDLTKKDPKDQGEAVRNDPYPRVLWVGGEDSEFEETLLDRAASYDQNNNYLRMNRDFRGYRDLVQFFAKEFNVFDNEQAQQVVARVVREMLELQAVEVIFSIRSLKGDEHWAGDPVAQALNPEALTAALSPRYMMTSAIRRNLAHALGGRS